MPFVITSSSEDFQRRTDNALEGLRDVKMIMYDVLVYGNGDSDENAANDHNSDIRELMKRLRE